MQVTVAGRVTVVVGAGSDTIQLRLVARAHEAGHRRGGGLVSCAAGANVRTRSRISDAVVVQGRRVGAAGNMSVPVYSHRAI